MKERSILTADQRELAELMSDISERCYCAGWLIDLEYHLWDIVSQLDFTDAHWGQDTITANDRAKLGALAITCGGWIRWDDETCETFVPIDEWKAMYVKQVGRYNV